MARWFQRDIAKLQYEPFGDEQLEIIDAEFDAYGDVRDYWTETISSAEDDIIMTWYDIKESHIIDYPPHSRPGRPHGVYACMIPTAGAQITINGERAEGQTFLADEYPDVVFEHISGYKANDTNFGNTFGRMYEPRYLSGMVAGSATSSNLIGYVAAFPIPEVIRGINAFTLGVREVNPDAEVEVNWTSTWFDPAVEGDAAQALLDKGADVIAMHQDSTAAGQAAEGAGARWVSYNSDMSAFAPDAYLTAPVWDWGPRYVAVIEAAQAGTYTPGYYWGSMADGVVDLAPIAADVDSGVKDQVLAAREAIIAGDLHPFTGPLYDQDGYLVLADGETMDDGTMLGMSFFVQGVIGSTG